MKRKKGTPPGTSDLRRRAEERLRETSRLSQAGPTSTDNALRLVQELQVHQVELELQNEELKAAQAESEAALERYTELYDYAPVGYLTLLRHELRRGFEKVRSFRSLRKVGCKEVAGLILA